MISTLSMDVDVTLIIAVTILMPLFMMSKNLTNHSGYTQLFTWIMVISPFYWGSDLF